MSDERERHLDRMKRRGSNRMISRTQHSVTETVRRLEERADGASVTRAPAEIEVVARDAGNTGSGASQDMRSAIARQLAELATLSGERGLLREEVAREAAPAAEETDQGDNSVFQQWYDQMAGSGLTDPEIEEIMVQRLRGLRRGMFALAETRKVGR